MSNHLIGKHPGYPAACALKSIAGLDQTCPLNNGTPLAVGFPQGVAIHLHPGIRSTGLPTHPAT